MDWGKEWVSHEKHCLQVKRITPRHLQLAIRGDEELDTLIKVCLQAAFAYTASPVHVNFDFQWPRAVVVSHKWVCEFRFDYYVMTLASNLADVGFL